MSSASVHACHPPLRHGSCWASAGAVGVAQSRSPSRCADEERVDDLPRRAGYVIGTAAGRTTNEFSLDGGRHEGESERAKMHLALGGPSRLRAGPPQARAALLEIGAARAGSDMHDSV